MEHLSLEIFDLEGTGSKYARLPENTSITITSTSEIFASGDVWSHSFTLNVFANAAIFGTSGDMHGSRLHEQLNNRRARLWVDGLPLYLGYLKLDDEVDVDSDGNVDVTFESGMKTFDEKIEGTKAREVSVGDVVIGVALNRKRVSNVNLDAVQFTMDGLEAYAAKDTRLDAFYNAPLPFQTPPVSNATPYTQQWPKLVKSFGKVYDGSWTETTIDYTNIDSPYDASHPFCNINICYPFKVNDKGEEKSSRGYTLRLARGQETTDGGDNQTRYNNAPNFYLLHFVDRLFKDLSIHIVENQALKVEDLRRVFMLNYGCHYEELENNMLDDATHTTPAAKLSRYGQYYIPIISADNTLGLVNGWDEAGQYTIGSNKGLEYKGKVLMRNVTVTKDDETILTAGSLEGVVQGVLLNNRKRPMILDKSEDEKSHNSYSAYLAYATGDNYPNVEIKEILDAMESAFGMRFIFSSDYQKVRIVLLRNIFRSEEVQDIVCDIISESKTENNKRGFRLTYNKGEDDTAYYYKGFADLFPRDATTWTDTTDTHDYSQWQISADYADIKNAVSAMNKTCYVTPVNGNAYGVKVDEDEDVLFPSLFEYAGYMDAEDGDCSGEESTIETVQIGMTPVLMNDVNGTYAVLFSGELKAPAPEDWDYVSWLSTYARITKSGFHTTSKQDGMIMKFDLDIYLSEGFRIRLLDNYSISNGGTPFDEADAGLCFGIMRSSGANAHINYHYDGDDGEGNDTWDVVPGDGAIDHPDTCDSYGNLWDYNGSDGPTLYCKTSADAINALKTLFPNSDIDLVSRTSTNYISWAQVWSVRADTGDYVNLLLATTLSDGTSLYNRRIRYYVNAFKGKSISDMWDYDKKNSNLLIEVGSSNERRDTLLALQRLAFGGSTEEVVIDGGDNGVGVTDGRFSLKLRAEKLNPYYKATNAPDGADTTNRYLKITNDNLRGRGLMDQFYKEYSYWIRNSRIAKLQLRMEIAQFLAIDKTKRVRIGDFEGFIKKMEFTVSNKDGLGTVTMELMYI